MWPLMEDIVVVPMRCTARIKHVYMEGFTDLSLVDNQTSVIGGDE